MLEKIKENKQKIARIEDYIIERKDSSFWSNFVNIFNPFKCVDK